jgi:death-on-curing protein
MKGTIDIGKLQGALSRIDSFIDYENMDDVFDIASEYIKCIATAHSLPDANKRTVLTVGLEYLSLNGFRINTENEMLADAIVDLVLGDISSHDLADILYSLHQH